MTKLLDKAIDTVRRLPPANQDEIASAMLGLARAGEGEAEDIDPAHLLDVLEGLAQARRREFATDADVAAASLRFDREPCVFPRALHKILGIAPIISGKESRPPRNGCAHPF